ncbi:hypothetical protein HOG48_01625 [Candidatus Peregrinibacteria bacterium]|jgi:hypothetical protein|nr:hypothetical protein [Candidatus Peregrinibacteria bacterium]
MTGEVAVNLRPLDGELDRKSDGGIPEAIQVLHEAIGRPDLKEVGAEKGPSRDPDDVLKNAKVYRIEVGGVTGSVRDMPIPGLDC